jgi:hypothetical protein
VACEKDIKEAILAVARAGYHEDDVAFCRLPTDETGEFGGVEIEEE